MISEEKAPLGTFYTADGLHCIWCGQPVKGIGENPYDHLKRAILEWAYVVWAHNRETGGPVLPQDWWAAQFQLLSLAYELDGAKGRPNDDPLLKVPK